MYSEAVEILNEAEQYLNKLIEQDTMLFPIANKVEFGNPNTSDLNEDVLAVFRCLEKVAEKWSVKACDLKDKIANYLNDTLMPKLKCLDILIVLSAFFIRNKPIVDLFTITTDGVRKYKTGREFVKLVSGSFMSHFYKVSSE